jgi:Zn finger protein HypA/HybF involved in hydrogenase expression
MKKQKFACSYCKAMKDEDAWMDYCPKCGKKLWVNGKRVFNWNKGIYGKYKRNK